MLYRLILAMLIVVAGCQDNSKQPLDFPQSYEPYLSPLIADGFDFTVGDPNGEGSYRSRRGKWHQGWYVATKTAEKYSLGIHTGEDWNGRGGGDTDIGQPVYSIGKGVVLAAQDYGSPWGKLVMLEHRYLENHRIETVYSLYGHLETVLVSKGDKLHRRQKLGTIGTGGGAYPAHLHLEIRKDSLARYPVDFWPSSNGKDVRWVKSNYHDVSSFINAHRETTVPAKEAQFILAIKHRYKLYYFIKGKLSATYEIALSQNPKGHKVKKGDNRLPEGAYNIIQKTRGPFPGKMGPWFGSAWMRINYPNPIDIIKSYEKGWITDKQRDVMIKAWQQGKQPDRSTKLGSGIGIHGWNGDWANDGDRALTWGCISMHNSDLDRFVDMVKLHTKIIIIP